MREAECPWSVEEGKDLHRRHSVCFSTVGQKRRCGEGLKNLCGWEEGPGRDSFQQDTAQALGPAASSSPCRCVTSDNFVNAVSLSLFIYTVKMVIPPRVSVRISCHILSTGVTAECVSHAHCPVYVVTTVKVMILILDAGSEVEQGTHT